MPYYTGSLFTRLVAILAILGQKDEPSKLGQQVGRGNSLHSVIVSVDRLDDGGGRGISIGHNVHAAPYRSQIGRLLCRTCLLHSIHRLFRSVRVAAALLGKRRRNSCDGRGSVSFRGGRHSSSANISTESSAGEPGANRRGGTADEMIYIITYDRPIGLLRGNERFLQEIRNLGSHSMRPMERTWLVASSLSIQQISDRLSPYLRGQMDRLLVVPLQETYQGWLPQEAWDWLHERIREGRLFR